MEPPEALHDGIYIPFTPRWRFKKTRSLLPCWCDDTGVSLWFKRCYTATFEEQFGHFSTVWISEEAYLMRCLKGEVHV